MYKIGLSGSFLLLDEVAASDRVGPLPSVNALSLVASNEDSSDEDSVNDISVASSCGVPFPDSCRSGLSDLFESSSTLREAVLSQNSTLPSASESSGLSGKLGSGTGLVLNGRLSNSSRG